MENNQTNSAYGNEQLRRRSLFSEISAQPALMVGVEEERLTTPWPRSLKLRHRWLQLNLLTAFLATASRIFLT
ncbi:MAG: hypothetical protein ABI728_09805, partial [Betaproteobacteria bacterium]